MKTELAFLFLAILLILVFIFYFVSAHGERKKITLANAEGKELGIEVEVADNLTTRAKGLMGRTSLGENEGMLFVFDRPDYYGFWMLNTTIPLDAIFLDENGTVVDVKEMDPCGINVLNCSLYTPEKKAKYVIEVNKGFSEEHHILPGKSSAAIPEKFQ
ncbi:hypothetical protein GF318_05505 [Candidatus Micrarchaeota archaeon]|nr:hypothetical protein [Candidatus Micrarchaeota archaeon]